MPKKRRVGDSDQAIGMRIKAHRMLRNLSQTDLANELGVTFQQIQKYERGSNRVSGSSLAKLCDVLNVSADVIIGRDAKRHPENPLADMLGDPLNAKLLMACQRLDGSTRQAVLDLARALAS